MQKTYKAGAYLRLSDKDLYLDPHEQSESIENQRAIIESFAAGNPDVELVGFFVDDGFTGLNYERDGFRDLMEWIEAGKINMVITKEMSRLGRELVQTLQLVKKEFVEKGVRFVAILDQIDSLQGLGSPMIPFKALMNDEYSRNISNSVTNTLRNLQRQGKYVAAFAPYGYRKDPGNKHRLVVDEAAAAVVQKIYRYYIDGKSINWICRKLTEDRETAPVFYKQQFTNYKAHTTLSKTNYWTYTTVWKILKNETYLGTVVQHTKEKLAYHLSDFQKVPQEQVIKVPNMHEPIVTREAFELVQQMMKQKRRESQANPEHPNLFAGILVCGECGRSLGRVRDHQYPRWHYRCNTSARMGKAYCSPHRIGEEQLQSLVLDAIREHVMETDVFQNTKWEPKDLCGEPCEKIRKLREQSREGLEKLELERSSMLRKLSKGILTEADFLLYKEAYGQEKEQLEHKIADLQRRQDRESREHAKYRAWAEAFAVRKELTCLSRELTVHLIRKIVVYETGIVEIQFRFADPFL